MNLFHPNWILKGKVKKEKFYKNCFYKRKPKDTCFSSSP